MRRLIILLVLSILPTLAVAQSLDFAWYATLGGGLSAHDNGPFSRRLQSYTPMRASGESMLYQTESFSSIGLNVDGYAGALFGGRYLIGLSGQRVDFPVVRSITSPDAPQDEYKLGAIGGGIDLGYLLLNRDATIIYPYLHAGYYGYSLEYHNNQSEPIPFFEGNPVPAGTSATYTGAAPRLGIGVALTKFIGAEGRSSFGGFVVSARVAYGTMLSAPQWEQDGEVVNNGGHTPCFCALAFTVSVGAGGGSQ